MRMHDHDSTRTRLQSYVPSYSKPMAVLVAACLSLLAVGAVLGFLGYEIWAGLFGAMTVIFLVTILLGTGLTWLLGRVSH